MGNLNQALKGAKAYQGQKIADRNSQVAAYAPLVKRVALHIKTRLPPNVDVHDMIQAGMIGLMEAIQNFKSGQGATFETYAAIRIRGAIIDELRLSDWAPRSVHQNTRAIRAASLKLTHQLGRPATDKEIAEYLKIDINKYYQMMLDTNMAQVMGIEDTGIPDDLLSDKPLSELIGQAPEDKIFEHMHDEDFKKALAEAIANLPERERNIVSFYYDQELNLREIGLVIGISESRTCQILGQAVEHLKKMLSEWFIPDDQRGLENRPKKEDIMAHGAKPTAPRRRRTSLLFDEDGEVSLENRYTKIKSSTDNNKTSAASLSAKDSDTKKETLEGSNDALSSYESSKAANDAVESTTPKKRPGRKPKAVAEKEESLNINSPATNEVAPAESVLPKSEGKASFEAKRSLSGESSLQNATMLTKTLSGSFERVPDESSDNEISLPGLRNLSSKSSNTPITRAHAEKANAAYAQTIKMGNNSMFKYNVENTSGATMTDAKSAAQKAAELVQNTAINPLENNNTSPANDSEEMTPAEPKRRRGRPPKNKVAE